MRVEPLVPDRAPAAAGGFNGTFGALLDAAGGTLASADAAERAFIEHRGALLDMMVERARADIALQVAAASAQRVAQGLQTLLGMQI